MNEIDKLKQRAGIPLKENEYKADPAEMVQILKSQIDNEHTSDAEFRQFVRNIIMAF